MRYGAKGLAEVPSHHGWEEQSPRTARAEVHQPFFGFTLVSCERGDIRQSPDGLIVYGEEAKKKSPLRAACVDAKPKYEAVFNNRPLFHDGRWGRGDAGGLPRHT